MKHTFWSAGSCTLLFAFLNITTYVVLAQVESFHLYVVMFISNCFVLPSLFLFLELSGYRKTIWSFWKSMPLFTHRGVCLFCFFWIVIALNGLIPVIRKDYEKR